MAFRSDELDARVARALRAVLRTLLVVLPVCVAAAALSPQSAPLEMVALAAILAVVLGIYFLNRLGHTYISAYALVFSLIAYATLDVLAYGSIRSTSSIGFFGAIVAGGMFLGSTALAIAAATGSACIGTLIFLENAGVLPVPDLRVGVHQWVIYTAALVAIAAPIYYARKLLVDLIGRARTSEEHFRQAFESSPIGMTITRLSDGRFLAVNFADSGTLGYSREEVLGRSALETSWLSAADRARFVDRLRVEGKVSSYPARMRRKDGRVADCMLWAAVMDIDGEPCVLTSAINVTESKRVEDELRANRRLLEQVVDAIPMSIFVKDRESRYTLVNRHMAGFFGTTKQELLDRRTPELPDSPAERKQLLRDDQWVFENRRALVQEILTRNAAGAPVPHHNSKIPLLDEAGDVIGLLCVNRDITEQREAQRRIEEANALLEARVLERTAQLEAANHELEAFSYSVSHDLKAPLRAIDGAVGFLRMKFGAALPDGSEPYFTRISRSARQMGALIEGLLEFARLSRQALERQETRPGEIVRTVLQGHEDQVRERSAVVDVRALPPCHADPLLLRQVYENLISNALKYSAQAKPSRIEIGAVGEGAETAYYVRDNGVGFDMAYAHKLGGVFERLHPPGQFEGTGIGLALVRRIIERHGGRLWAESAPGSGATFHFSLAPR